jgi:hypothetical protein
MDVFAVEQNLSASGLEQARQHLHGGAFSRAIRAEASEDLPGAKVKLTSFTATTDAYDLVSPQACSMNDPLEERTPRCAWTPNAGGKFRGR